MAGVSIFQDYVVQEKSPFDLEKLSEKFRRRHTGWSTAEAYLCILLTASVADGDFDPEEAESIKTLARRSRTLSALPAGELAKINAIVSQRMGQNPNALQEACGTLPADMCLPVFAHCVEIILADGQLLKSEAEFLDEIAKLLEINPEHARRMLEALLLKAQY
jgi:uncharacterized tellurite resistance protein B-like protein